MGRLIGKEVTISEIMTEDMTEDMYRIKEYAFGWHESWLEVIPQKKILKCNVPRRLLIY